MINQIKLRQPTTLKAKLGIWLPVLLALTSLACSLGRLSAEPPRKVVHIKRTLPTLTPTAVVGSPQDVAVAEAPGQLADVSAVPQEPIANITPLTPSDTPVATPTPLPTPASVYTTPPSVADNQNNSRPTLTSHVTLNIRSGPGLDHSVVGKLAVGQSAGITGQNPDGSWWQIEYPSGSGRQAWVSADPQYSTVSRTMPQTIAQASTPASRPGAAAVTTPPPLPSPIPEPVTPPNPEPNPVPVGSGWTFIGVQVSYQDKEGIIIDGDIINNTGAPQEIVKLTGTVYDSQGQGVASVDDAAAYWPLETVPPGGQVPFEMAVYHIQDIADFDLEVVSQPSRENPRQDFELSDLDPSIDGGNYCVTGKLWNRGDPLLDYLLILVVLYNDQDKVVNFGIFQGNSPENVLGDEALPFEVCTDSYNHQVARHELRAIGL